MSDSKGAAIDDVLRQFRQYLLHGIMSDTPHQMTFDEAVEAILAILAQEVKRVRIEEFKRPINLPLLEELDQDFKDGFLNAVEMMEEVRTKRIKDLERLG